MDVAFEKDHVHVTVMTRILRRLVGVVYWLQTAGEDRTVVRLETLQAFVAAEPNLTDMQRQEVIATVTNSSSVSQLPLAVSVYQRWRWRLLRTALDAWVPSAVCVLGCALLPACVHSHSHTYMR